MNKFDPCKPWILKYIKNKLKAETADDDHEQDCLYYVGQIRKIHFNSNVNELIIADGLHKIKCHLNGFIADDDVKKQYIENKMINLKQFELKIDGITKDIYLLVSNSEIYKFVPLLPSIYGAFCRDINKDHRIQTLLQQRDGNQDENVDENVDEIDVSTSSKTETVTTININGARKRCLNDIDDDNHNNYDIEPPSKRPRLNHSEQSIYSSNINSNNSLPPEIDHEPIISQQIDPILNDPMPPIIPTVTDLPQQPLNTNIVDTGYNDIDYMNNYGSMPINDSIPSYIDHSHHNHYNPSIPPILATPPTKLVSHDGNIPESIPYHDITLNPLENLNEIYTNFQCKESMDQDTEFNENDINNIYVPQQFDQIPNISNDLSNLSQVISTLIASPAFMGENNDNRL